MAYSGLSDFISELEKHGELHRIKEFVDPLLEITEVTDRVTKAGGKALLFENTGTSFPLLINAFGSEKRMTLALGGKSPDDQAGKIEKLFSLINRNSAGFSGKISALPALARIAGYLPVKTRKRGLCQQVVHNDPDLAMLPALKCWPHDGGRFLTLPVVHTLHPLTANTNAGMYRMQILGKNRAAMHWQRHKTGASHYEAWKKRGAIMPVAVTLGGDPVYIYAATAPLPENISEYILAGFLREKKVRLVKCVTNDIYVPYDADIVIEGYVDTSEKLVWEGPFGDHTGFYSLADWYPGMHVTCITHMKNAVYPATIVGVPPQEDAWLARATEKIFLSPVKLALQPEVEDFHMPEAGVAHNLVLVKINKTYPGQGMKVINSLFGAGQMMFTKYLVVVSGNVGIRDYAEVMRHIFINTDFNTDITFSRGPLDVLDHSSDNQAFGGKAGVDATIKFPEEKAGNLKSYYPEPIETSRNDIPGWFEKSAVKASDQTLSCEGIPVLIVSVNTLEDHGSIDKIADTVRVRDVSGLFRLVVAVDEAVDPGDYFRVAWQVLGNSDPRRDHRFISPQCLLIDGTIKLIPGSHFPRKWPNVVCSSVETAGIIDDKWDKLGFDAFIPSPSLRNMPLRRYGNDEIITDGSGKELS